jgi:hypothetical protein
MTGAPSIELTVMPDHDIDYALGGFKACWADGDELVSHVPYNFLDLMPFMIARALLEHGYNLERLLVVRLRGADYEMARAPLGQLAATPRINTARPVMHPQRSVRRGEASA